MISGRRCDVAHLTQLRRWRTAGDGALEPWQRAALELADREFGDSWWLGAADAKFARGLKALGSFVAREGHGLVPVSHVDEGFPLGNWVGTRRREFVRGTLAEARITELNAVPGWAWDVAEQRRVAAFSALDAFIAREGHAAVPHSHIEAGFPLGNWVSRCRRERATGVLRPDHAAELESRATWVWDQHEQRYADGLRALDRFTAREGHAAPHRTHVEDGLPLGAWVRDRRKDFAKGRLSEVRTADLTARPGWVWALHEQRYADGLRALDRFVAREGHAAVPQSHVEDGFRLGSWAGVRRKDHAEGRLAADRVADLSARPGWLWMRERSATVRRA